MNQIGWTSLVIPDGYDVFDIDDQQEEQVIFEALYAAEFKLHAI
ncbi:hypothetical protein SH601_11605 [Gracilibacillus sp. S3-1-1]|uniref:Uncharacterized protein n=1 Tax=Gracilibacillus pellucidus TaxID=3095368 RepID=A0ACC6M6L5_9BACI|nr:hypothetical protein [Gracilibacillus sp. S3-1-1]MDX8046626.1 hypothetical protein [Gracilibacillus sp. S3-1-1]